jgi:hypothetical protein
MPQQIPRLVLVFAVAVVGLLVARNRLIPEPSAPSDITVPRP